MWTTTSRCLARQPPWRLIGDDIKVDVPEDKGTYLGCRHARATVKLTRGSEARCLLYDMQAFFVTCLSMHQEHARRANPKFQFSVCCWYKGRFAPTSFASGISSASGAADLVASDALVRGVLAVETAGDLMKLLYGARRARSDLLRATNALARLLTKWTQRCDALLYRLMCYVHSTVDYLMIGWVCDPRQCMVNTKRGPRIAHPSYHEIVDR